MDRSGSGITAGSIFYLTRPAAGGMRGHLRALITHFSRTCPVHLAAPAESNLAIPPGFTGGVYLELPLSAGINPSGDLRSFWRLYRLLKSLRPSLVHIHGFKAALVGLPAASLARVPVLVTVHNFPAHRGQSVLPLTVRGLGGGAARYIAVSHSLARELTRWGISPARVSVIHNGIETESFERAGRRFSRGGGRGRPVVVGTVARMAPQKGLPVFIRAAARLASQFPEMRFVVAGDGPERGALEKLAFKLGLRERLSFPGYCADLPARLAEIDIFVLPSLTEGMAITLLEAMAAGCTVVAARVGGVPEVIEDRVTGRLVLPGDDAALAASIASLACNPGQAVRLARTARDHVRRNFSLEKMLARTEAVYRELLVPGTIN